MRRKEKKSKAAEEPAIYQIQGFLLFATKFPNLASFGGCRMEVRSKSKVGRQQRPDPYPGSTALIHQQQLCARLNITPLTREAETPNLDDASLGLGHIEY